VKILLDECLPKRLTRLLADHEVSTVRQMNWLGLSNGRLLAVANPQFDVFLTVDQNLVRQQDLTGFRIAVIVLHARSNRIEDLGPLMSLVMQLLPSIQPGTVTFLPQ
jgi:predicted nuclease of predicted toxin-antitoxin system